MKASSAFLLNRQGPFDVKMKKCKEKLVFFVFQNERQCGNSHQHL